MRQNVKSFWSALFAQEVDTNPPFQFQKRSQLFIGTHNETLSVIPVCIDNPDCSSAQIDDGNTAPTPTGFAQVITCLRYVFFPNVAPTR